MMETGRELLIHPCSAARPEDYKYHVMLSHYVKATSRHVSSPRSWLELSHHHSKTGTTRRIPLPPLLILLHLP
jgi:hypothetical protein